ncbi:la-related protein 6A [Oryza glaberrima]|uniref:HTH La-type RNA-binding domain-containing protein n=1 Tax=Oryza glaberrima TaxID=4538 RepID=I1NRR1_ORYGL|nr:la-related protein 6A [Oryza glaberrima]
MDLQDPAADAVAAEPLTVAETDDQPPPPAPPLEAEGVVVAEEDPLPHPPLEVVEEDVAPVVAEAGAAAVPMEPSEAGAGGVVLTDELCDRIVKQVEYYFSDENLPTDEFLIKFVKKNKQGFVPIGVIASFRRMKKLSQDLSIIEAALRTSSKLVVSPDGKRVRRLHPLPNNELNDVKKRIVVAENLPSDFSMESIHAKFETVGKIAKITIHDQHSVGESATIKNHDIMLSNKVHALVEYETAEAAEKAAITLNDGSNWRTGMKVRLAKRTVGSGKHNQSSKENQAIQGQPSKVEQQMVSEKNGGTDSVESAFDNENVNSNISHEDMHQHQKVNAKGGRKGRYKSQGRGQIQQNTSGQGHVSSPATSGSDHVNKPIPGPRMPDGRRGFTMGRGKSPTFQKGDNAEE